MGGGGYPAEAVDSRGPVTRIPRIAQNVQPGGVSDSELQANKKNVIVDFGTRLKWLQAADGSREYNANIPRDHVVWARLQVSVLELFLTGFKDAALTDRLIKELLGVFLKPETSLTPAERNQKKWLEKAFTAEPQLRLRAFLILAERGEAKGRFNDVEAAYQQILTIGDAADMPEHLNAKRWLFTAQIGLRHMTSGDPIEKQEEQITIIQRRLANAEKYMTQAGYLRTERGHIRADALVRQGWILRAKKQDPTKIFQKALTMYDEALKCSRESEATAYDRSGRRFALQLGKLKVYAALQNREKFDAYFKQVAEKMPAVLRGQAWAERAKLYFEAGVDPQKPNKEWVKFAHEFAVKATDLLRSGGLPVQQEQADGWFVRGESAQILGQLGDALASFQKVIELVHKDDRPLVWTRAKLSLSLIQLIGRPPALDSAARHAKDAEDFLVSAAGQSLSRSWLHVAHLRRAESRLWQNTEKLFWKDRVSVYSKIIEGDLAGISPSEFKPKTLQAEYYHQLAIAYEGLAWAFFEKPRYESWRSCMIRARNLYLKSHEYCRDSDSNFDRTTRQNEVKSKADLIDKYLREFKAGRKPQPPNARPHTGRNGSANG